MSLRTHVANLGRYPISDNGSFGYRRPNGTDAAGNYGGATFGIFADNQVKAGGAGHWLGEASQLIVEGNTFAGFSLVSGGSNIATYQGGYSQHIFMGGNVMSDVWANVSRRESELARFQHASDTVAGRTARL